jgi:large subunit ribosomal protein L25
MKAHSLLAEKRDFLGKKVKKLRKDGIIPANIYGKTTKSTAISVKHVDFTKTYKETGETGLIEITLKGQKDPHHVLVNNVQIHPVSDDIIHVDFHQVELKENITVPVPFTFTGESPAATQKKGVLITLLNEVEVEALPTELPEEIIVDLTTLAEVGDEVKIGDLKVAGKVKIMAEKDEVVVRINALEKEEEAAPVAPAEGEAPTEGEAPSEGAPAAAEAPKSEEKKD